MYKVITIEQCKILAKNKGGKCLSNKYINGKAYLLWECKNKHRWEATIHSIKHHNSWCPHCIKLTIQNCQKFAKTKNGVCLSKNYTNIMKKMKWECKKGHTWQATFNDIKNGNRWCPECAHRKKHTIQDCKKLAKIRNGKCLSIKYKNNKTILTWQCKQKHIWKTSFNKIAIGQWCPKCYNHIKFTLKHAQLIAASKNGLCLSKKYISAKSQLKWKCARNHIWKATYACVKFKTWCPECCARKSQNQLQNIIKSIFLKKVIQNYKGFEWLKSNKNKNKQRMEIDLWIPSLKVAIEYDGAQHFKAVKFFGGKKVFKETKKRDKLKNAKIAAHPNDVKYFIRFNYKDKLTKKDVLAKLLKYLPKKLFK